MEENCVKILEETKRSFMIKKGLKIQIKLVNSIELSFILLRHNNFQLKFAFD